MTLHTLLKDLIINFIMILTITCFLSALCGLVYLVFRTWKAASLPGRIVLMLMTLFILACTVLTTLGDYLTGHYHG